MKTKEVLGTYGDELALEILLDPTLTPKERDRLLAEAAKKFSTAVKSKINRGR